MKTPAEIAEAARALVAHYNALTNGPASDVAAYRTLITSIDELLPAASHDDELSEDAAFGIGELAASLPETRVWMKLYLRTDKAAASRDYVEPVGPPIETSLAPRYVCPNRDYKFYRPTVGTRVPPCPHDGQTLVRA